MAAGCHEKSEWCSRACNLHSKFGRSVRDEKNPPSQVMKKSLVDSKNLLLGNSAIHKPVEYGMLFFSQIFQWLNWRPPQLTLLRFNPLRKLRKIQVHREQQQATARCLKNNNRPVSLISRK